MRQSLSYRLVVKMWFVYVLFLAALATADLRRRPHHRPGETVEETENSTWFSDPASDYDHDNDTDPLSFEPPFTGTELVVSTLELTFTGS